MRYVRNLALSQSLTISRHGWLTNLQNPLNWPRTKKVFVCIQIFPLDTFIYLGSSIYSPGIDDIVKEFGVSQVFATLGTSLSLLGYAIGPMLWSPMSKVPWIGRNTIYIVTLAAFLLLKLPIVLASNIETILVFRFLTAFAGSPAQATGGATISDMYIPRDRSYGLGLWELSTWIGPTLGPLVGGFATQAKGWRWTIGELIWVNGAMLVLSFFFFPETSASNILYRRAKRLRQEAGIGSIRAESELESLHFSKKDVAYKTLVRPFVLCFQEPIYLLSPACCLLGLKVCQLSLVGSTALILDKGV